MSVFNIIIRTSEWSCPTCTLINTGDVSQCDVCGEVNPSINVLNLIQKINSPIEQFIFPFIMYMNDIYENKYTKSQLIFALQELYTFPCNCLSCHLKAYQKIIIDQLENPSNDVTIRHEVIFPTISSILASGGKDPSAIQIAIYESWHLDQESKPKPASQKTINLLLKLPHKNIEASECFCGDSENKEGVITLPCCSKDVHLNCIKKWFETNSTCPYCRKEIFMDSNDESNMDSGDKV